MNTENFAKREQKCNTCFYYIFSSLDREKICCFYYCIRNLLRFLQARPRCLETRSELMRSAVPTATEIFLSFSQMYVHKNCRSFFCKNYNEHGIGSGNKILASSSWLVGSVPPPKIMLQPDCGLQQKTTRFNIYSEFFCDKIVSTSTNYQECIKCRNFAYVCKLK